METLKDIKDVLNKIPDDILDRCLFGIGEGQDDNVGLICMEEETTNELTYLEVFEKYPDLMKIHKLIENIKKAQSILDEQDYMDELVEDLQQEGVTDTYFDDKKERHFGLPSDNSGLKKTTRSDKK